MRGGAGIVDLGDSVAKLIDGWNIEHRIEHDKFVLRRSRLRVRLPPINEDIAYLLGFLCGDGCLVKPLPRKRIGGFRFKINICFSGSEKGRAQAWHICTIFKRCFHYEPRVFNKKREGRKDWLEVEINSAVIYAYFYLLGLPIGEKYGKLKVPSAVFTETLFKKFLQGLIDSDGYIGRRHRVVIVQKDMNFLGQVRELSLKFLNVKFSIPQPNSKKVGDQTYTWYYILTSQAERLGAPDINKI